MRYYCNFDFFEKKDRQTKSYANTRAELIKHLDQEHELIGWIFDENLKDNDSSVDFNLTPKMVETSRKFPELLIWVDYYYQDGSAIRIYYLNGHTQQTKGKMSFPSISNDPNDWKKE